MIVVTVENTGVPLLSEDVFDYRNRDSLLLSKGMHFPCSQVFKVPKYEMHWKSERQF